MKFFDEIKLFWAAKDVWNTIQKEKTSMNMSGSFWNKISVFLHIVGPQIINLVLMIKGMLPPQYGIWATVVLGIGGYAIHVYHDVKKGGVAALAEDVSQLSVTATATK